MTRLKSKLLTFNSSRPVPAKIFSPANCEELRIPFKTDKIAKVVGKLASIPPPLPHKTLDSEDAQPDDDSTQPNLISGVLIQNDFKISLMAPEDLMEYAGLTTTTIVCRQHLMLSAAGVDLIRWALEGTFGAIKEQDVPNAALDGKQVNGNGAHGEYADEEVNRASTKYLVMDCVTVLCQPGGKVEVEWEGNVINDGIADAVLAVLFTVESSPAAVRRTSLPLPPSKQTTQLTNPTESSRQHAHSHSHAPAKPTTTLAHRFSQPNPHRTPDPATRLARLFLFLEAQFGESAITPIAYPRTSTLLPPLDAATTTTLNPTTTATTTTPPPSHPFSVAAAPTTSPSNPSIITTPDPTTLPAPDRAELKRLHGLGVPVPGLEIRFERYVARVWLEELDVECKSAALRARVKAVVERGVETISGLWA